MMQKEVCDDHAPDFLFFTKPIYVISKWLSPFCNFLKNLTTFACHFVTYSREYYEWLSKLTRRIQISKLPVQTPCAFLEVYSPNLLYKGSCDLHFKLVMMQWRKLDGGTELALPHANKWLQTHFVFLAKIIALRYLWNKVSLSCFTLKTFMSKQSDFCSLKLCWLHLQKSWWSLCWI